jgi:hypothetical protein
MTLDLAQLLPQVSQLATDAADRAADRNRRLPEAGRALEAAARLDPQALLDRIGRAGTRWRGARPTDEPVGAAYPAPPHPERLHVMGADGSQVLPDRHAIASFYLINIGSLHLIHGSGEPPQVASRPSLHFRDEELYDETLLPIDAALVAGRRDAAEMGELARLSDSCRGESALTLLDNALLLWVALQERDQRRHAVDRILQAYLTEMGHLQQSGAALAGFVDRPGSVNALALVHLAGLPLDSVNPESLQANPFRRLLDRDLFAQRLQPGERTARFASTSPLNADFHKRGQEIQFFYLHTGYQNQIARVEVPEWVGQDSRRLGWVHAGILEQCRTTGIPYPLVRAHELAVVAQADRAALEQLLQAALLRAGLRPHISQKAQTKRWTAQRRRHRL